MAQDEATIAYPFPRSPSLFHPSPVYGELREECPVTRVATPDGKSAWLVTRYSDVRQVLIDPRFSRAAAGSDVPLAGLARLASESMPGMDPPEHTRLRKLVARAFTVRRVEELRPRVAGEVDELLGAMQSRPRPADLVEHFAVPLPIRVICELLGVPAQDQHILHGWSDTIMGDWQQNPSDLERAVQDLGDYFASLIAAKRANRDHRGHRGQPADDLMTALIAARDEDDRLSERELTVLCLGLLIVGHETTVSHISMSLLTLLEHQEEFARLRADPGLVPQAVEELLRFNQVSDGGGTLPRVATEEVEVGGVQLPAGAVVMQATNSANRDGGQFAEPDRLDICRAENRHLTFGAGIHHCLGAQLARVELQEALRGLLRHMPSVHVTVPEPELRFKRGMFLRSLEALPVSW